MRNARHHTTRGLIAALTLAFAAGLPGIAHAQQPPSAPGLQPGAQPILFPNSSSSYNQQGFNLPTAPRATGQDVVRGAGGISCQSAIGSGGPTLDMGVIGTNDIYNRDSAALYGRVTIPLGKRPRRVDCTRLFELEVSRLQMELQLMRDVQNMADKAAAEPAVFEDAAPPSAFSIGDRARQDLDDAPRSTGFILGSPGQAQGGKPSRTEPSEVKRSEAPRASAPVATPDPNTTLAKPAAQARPRQAAVVVPQATRAAVPDGDHIVQVAAYRSEARAWDASQIMIARLSLPRHSSMVIRPKRVRGAEFHTLQVMGLSRVEVDAVCARLGGDCIRL